MYTSEHSFQALYLKRIGRIKFKQKYSLEDEANEIKKLWLVKKSNYDGLKMG